MQSTDSVTTLKGVGKEVERKLTKLGIVSLADLMHYYPRRYEDFSQLTPIGKLKPGAVTVRGKITHLATRRTFRRGFTITEAVIEDDTGAIKAVWFNQPYLGKSLPKATEVFVSGNLEFKSNQYALQNPSVERVSSFTKNTARIIPIYAETDGLSSKQIRSLIEQILPLIKELPDVLPNTVIKEQKLCSSAAALEQIHFPVSGRTLKTAQTRLGFEELFYLILTGLVIKKEIKTENASRVAIDKTQAKEFVDKLPFKLTNAQRKAAWQILQDMQAEHPMNRLLEGDVGSGKTVVATLAASQVINGGYQVALMAPTEILARQHYQTISALLDVNKKRYSVIYLGSSVKKALKSQIYEQLKNGKIDIVVGTHALLQPDVGFKNLGLVVIDEQHRFGVNQRIELKNKAGRLPHLLSMSATPIPRSLALTIYGDLDISILDELPPGRQTIITKVAAERTRADVYAHIDEQIKTGRQVYVICPLIAESDKLGVKSVEAESERLKNSVFRHRRIGVLNGRMKPTEKQAIMDKFAHHEIDILVSTTVVEVGVDIPNATVMLIEGAERFGLASLHQLRGRVGRGQHQSYCYVLTTNERQARERLELLEKYDNGFILAQKDLELRGPGAMYGTRQHGLLDLKIANLADTKLIAQARLAAEGFLETSPDLIQYPQVVKRINKLKNVTTLD